ncbi:MAG: tetratricopeptide repeat protein [Ktedonobacteraceae bacterium]|nr:tetratricopeptide repeat protein [Ktedonobacteraceae bacterium]
MMDEQDTSAAASDSSDELRKLAHAHLQVRHWSQAQEIFLKLLAQNQEDEDALTGLGAALDGLGQYNALYELAERLLTIVPNSAHGLAYKARALQKLERLSEATIANDQALLLDTRLGLAWINRSGLQLLQQKLPEALRSSYRAIELAPDDARAWTNHSLALLNFHRLAEAFEAINRSLELDRANLLALQIKSDILCKQGRMRDALPVIHAALALAPTHIPSLIQAIQALRSLEMYAQLKDVARQLTILLPDDPFAWENYMRALRGLGAFEASLEALDRLLELDPMNARTWTFKADSLYRTARYREAASTAERALRLAPDYAPALRLQSKATRMMYQKKEKHSNRP